MKRVAKELTLNKETIVVLDSDQMNNVKGGFTSILSLGRVCRSNNNPTNCATTGGACGGQHRYHKPKYERLIEKFDKLDF